MDIVIRFSSCKYVRIANIYSRWLAAPDGPTIKSRPTSPQPTVALERHATTPTRPSWILFGSINTSEIRFPRSSNTPHTKLAALTRCLAISRDRYHRIRYRSRRSDVVPRLQFVRSSEKVIDCFRRRRSEGTAFGDETQ